jgi:hypothetical protein
MQRGNFALRRSYFLFLESEELYLDPNPTDSSSWFASCLQCTTKVVRSRDIKVRVQKYVPPFTTYIPIVLEFSIRMLYFSNQSIPIYLFSLIAKILHVFISRYYKVGNSDVSNIALKNNIDFFNYRS